MKKIVLLIVSIVFFSCGGTTPEKITSNSISDLGRHIDLTKYRPTAVQFEYTFFDNSKGLFTGPSDSVLEAVLYFDPETFGKLVDEYKNVDYISPGLTAADFDFNWLHKELKDELAKSPAEYSGHPDLSFRKSPTSTLWFLGNKVLLRHYVN